MTYAYTLGSRRRLVLGPPHAPARLCVPIPSEVYDAVAALPERAQGAVVQTLETVLRHLMEDLGEAGPEASAAAPLVEEEEQQQQQGDDDQAP